MRCESSALTTATVDETGKGQHRGAKVAPELERRFIQFRQAPFPMCRKAIGIFVGLFPEASVHLNKRRVEQRTNHELMKLMVWMNCECTCQKKKVRNVEEVW